MTLNMHKSLQAYTKLRVTSKYKWGGGSFISVFESPKCNLPPHPYPRVHGAGCFMNYSGNGGKTWLNPKHVIS